MSKVLLEKWAKITLYEARKVEVETDTHLHTVKKEHNYRYLGAIQAPSPFMEAKKGHYINGITIKKDGAVVCMMGYDHVLFNK